MRVVTRETSYYFCIRLARASELLEYSACAASGNGRHTRRTVPNMISAHLHFLKGRTRSRVLVHRSSDPGSLSLEDPVPKSRKFDRISRGQNTNAAREEKLQPFSVAKVGHISRDLG